jgi:hypothetical protein
MREMEKHFLLFPFGINIFCVRLAISNSLAHSGLSFVFLIQILNFICPSHSHSFQCKEGRSIERGGRRSIRQNFCGVGFLNKFQLAVAALPTLFGLSSKEEEGLRQDGLIWGKQRALLLLLLGCSSLPYFHGPF